MDTFREWVIPLGISSGIPIFVILLIIYRLRVERKHGKTPPLPSQVEDLKSLLETTNPIFNNNGYIFVGYFNGRKLYRKTAVANNGTWEISVECDENELIAFEAVFQSPHSLFLFKKTKGSRKTPRALGAAESTPPI